MNIRKILLSCISLLVLDYMYLSSQSNIFKNIPYAKQNIKGSIIPIILCYTIIIGVLQYFIIQKFNYVNLDVLMQSFILGFSIYSIYELTNYILLKNWPLYFVIVDSLWGGILFMLVTYITIKII